MDDRSKEFLQKIRTKTAGELTKQEIAFLKSRISYLSVDDKDRYKSVLQEKKVEKKTEKKEKNA